MFKLAEIKIGAALIGLLLVAAIYIVHLERSIDTLKTEKSDVTQFAKGPDSTTYYKNKHGQEVAKNEAQTLSYRDLVALRETDRLAWINGFENLNKRANNLEQAQRTFMTVMTNFKIPLRDTTIVNADSSVTHARRFDNHNKWISLKGTIFPDTLDIDPIVSVPLNTVVYYQRKKIIFFRIGKKTYFTESTSDNPYVKITRSEVTRVEKKR